MIGAFSSAVVGSSMNSSSASSGSSWTWLMYAITLRPVAPSTTSRNCCSIAFWKLLLPNEEFLVRNGEQDAVADLRHQYQKAIEPTFRAAVERATGRRVIGFASHVALEQPMFALEVFGLEPR